MCRPILHFHLVMLLLQPLWPIMEELPNAGARSGLVSARPE
jgi:hypothetical protein